MQWKSLTVSPVSKVKNARSPRLLPKPNSSEIANLKKMVKFIALVIRNRMEDYHVAYLSDNEMARLNPRIRNGVLTVLWAWMFQDGDAACDALIQEIFSGSVDDLDWDELDLPCKNNHIFEVAELLSVCVKNYVMEQLDEFAGESDQRYFELEHIVRNGFFRGFLLWGAAKRTKKVKSEITWLMLCIPNYWEEPEMLEVFPSYIEALQTIGNGESV